VTRLPGTSEHGQPNRDQVLETPDCAYTQLCHVNLTLHLSTLPRFSTSQCDRGGRKYKIIAKTPFITSIICIPNSITLLSGYLWYRLRIKNTKWLKQVLIKFCSKLMTHLFLILTSLFPKRLNNPIDFVKTIWFNVQYWVNQSISCPHECWFCGFQRTADRPEIFSRFPNRRSFVNLLALFQPFLNYYCYEYEC
jgi:hypothetical protein